MLTRLRRLLIGSEALTETVIYECRDCGTTLAEPTDTCPECDGDAIARYEL